VARLRVREWSVTSVTTATTLTSATCTIAPTANEDEAAHHICRRSQLKERRGGGGE